MYLVVILQYSPTLDPEIIDMWSLEYLLLLCNYIKGMKENIDYCI